MLVLQRRNLEKIRIQFKGVEAIVTVVDSKNGVAKIGVEAPKEVRIDREEVYQQRKVEHGS